MVRLNRILSVWFCMGLLVPAAGPALAQSSNEPDLYKAYYLEHEVEDYAAAKVLYEKVADRRVSSEVARVARRGAARCRDHMAARNFASLMPDDAVVYVELTRPGQIVEKVLAMVGLAGEDDMGAVLAQRPDEQGNAPFHMPKRVTISPALLDALSSFGGGAVGLTSIDTHGGPPSGVMVLHHGDVKLLKGLLETAFQFAPTGRKIHDLPTFAYVCDELGPLTGVLTESLLIIGSGRDLVEGSVNRLMGSGTTSLAAREDLRELSERRQGSAVFSYVDMQAMLAIARSEMSERDRREFDRIDAVANFDSLRWAAFSLGIHDGELGIELALRLADDHHNIIYNLMRLPPMSRVSLQYVPADAAAVFGLGLNPAWSDMATQAAGERDERMDVTGLDLFRELFGNIREVSGFVVPGKFTRIEHERVPNIGVVMAVNDVARSKATWRQLLSLPGLIGGDEPEPPKDTKIGDTPVTVFRVPVNGRIYMAELGNCLAIGMSRTAIKASIKTAHRTQSVLQDDIMGRAIANLPTDSSVMAVAHVGRLAEVGVSSGELRAEEAMVVQQAARYCSEMIASMGVGQSPNQMSLRVSIGGLPNVNDVVAQFGPMIEGFAAMAAPPQVAHMPIREEKPRSPAPPDESHDEAESTEASNGAL